uniref:C3H1-type domain-containing protein n=1 Tax=Lotus japonicus TaxID=34305 RepID=I3S9S8_LOTJA|nr:unknown [Lotus japonicus]
MAVNADLSMSKHFNFGNGNCPFGARCFYKHTVKQGSYTDIHRKPPPRHRPNNYDMYDVLDMLNEVDLQPEEYYSIMRDSEFFDEMDACEMMALSQSMGLYNSDEEDEYNFFQMAAFSEAMASGVDDFGHEDFENEEFNPMEAALFSMMMHSNMEEEEEDDDDDDDDESDEHFF